MNIKKKIQAIFSFDLKIILTFVIGFLLSVQIYAQPGRLDLNFPQHLAAGANVTAIERQNTSRVLVAGKFTTRGAVVRRDIIRLHADGSLDSTFNLGSGTDEFGLIRFMKLDADAKIIVAGDFNRINGVSRNKIARLDADGNVDPTFNLSGIDVTFINDLDVQTDGKILISASNLLGTSFVARLNNNGSLDASFNFPFFGGSNSNFKVAFAPLLNKIYVGGNFLTGLALLNLDGSVDTAFNATVSSSQPGRTVDVEIFNGRILVWGKFDTVNGAARRNLAVLTFGGSLDQSFNPATRGTENILSVAAQTNGKIIIGGSNFGSDTFLRGNVARLNANGTIDTTFNQGKGASGGEVRALSFFSGTKLLVGGTFFRYHIFPRSGLAQINL